MVAGCEEWGLQAGGEACHAQGTLGVPVGLSQGWRDLGHPSGGVSSVQGLELQAAGCTEVGSMGVICVYVVPAEG